ncbi:MAG: amino acid ABC transporter substrate-binding protein [Oscillospiraceae bacterium]
MKKKYLGIAVLAAAFALLLCACSEEKNEKPAENAKKDTLVMGLDDSFPPMGYRDENNEIVGFDIDLAQEVAKRLGVELVLTPVDWATKELELSGGKIDVIWNGLTITPERKAEMLMTDVYIANAQVVVVKADSDVKDIDGLKGKSVAYQTGSSAEGAWKSSKYNGTEKETITGADNVTLLMDLGIGRIDAVVVDKVVADYYISKEDSGLRVLQETLAPEEYGIAFAKGNDELFKKVTGALSEMVADGTAAKISQKWFGENRIIFE